MEYNEQGFWSLEKSTSILLNSVVDYFCIELKDGEIGVKIGFVLRAKGYSRLFLSISSLNTVSINQNIQSIGQELHNYKFLKFQNGYYLCLDPDESTVTVNENDQDIFIYEKLNAVIE